MTYLLGAAPILCLLLGGFAASRRAHRTARLALGAAAVSITWQWVHGRSGATGTLDADPFSVFFTGLVVVDFALGSALGGGRPSSERFWTVAGLVLAVSSRDVLWIVAGLALFSLLSVRSRWSVAPALSGVLVLLLSGSGTDLARLPESGAARIGLALVTLGIVLLWVALSKKLRSDSLAVGVVVSAFWVRLGFWVPELSAVWALAFAVSTIVAGGLGAALAGRTPSFLAWAAAAQIGLAVLGTRAGPPALASVVLHTAAAVIAIRLLALLEEDETTGSLAASWLLALSLASAPPLPGFVTKLPLLAALSPVLLTLALFGGALVAVGSARLIVRMSVPGAEKARILLAVTVLFALAFGVFPDGLFEWAGRAAAGLF